MNVVIGIKEKKQTIVGLSALRSSYKRNEAEQWG